MYSHHVLFLKPPEMAQWHRNDSSQMSACLHQDDHSDKRDKQQDDKEHEGKHKSEKESNAKPKYEGERDLKHKREEENKDAHRHKKQYDNNDSSSSTCSVSCPAVPSGTAAAGPRKSEGNDQWRGGTTPSCCSLLDLKHLPDCDIKLGDLRYSNTHTVLIDVSFSTFNFVVLYNTVHLLKTVLKYNVALFFCPTVEIINNKLKLLFKIQMCISCIFIHTLCIYQKHS